MKKENIQGAEAEELANLNRRIAAVDAALLMAPDKISSMTMDQLAVTVSKFEADGHELPSANRRMICANAASEACRKRDFAQALACRSR